MKGFNLGWLTRLKEKARSKGCALCFWKRSRYITSLEQKLRADIAALAGLDESETLVMMLDDSVFRTRDKNVILTNRRILFQNTKGGKYVSVALDGLKDASVFAQRVGSETVLCIVCLSNALSPVAAQIRLKHFAIPDTPRTIFHDYLSKYCPAFAPFNEDNYKYYKKTVSPLLYKTPAAAVVLSAAGVASLAVLALFDVVFTVKTSNGRITQTAVCVLLMITILAWTANVLIPASKSKMSKLLLLLVFSVWHFVLDYYPYLHILRRSMTGLPLAFPNQVSLAAKVLFALLWLLFDKADFDKLTRIVASVLAGLSILLAFMGLAAGIRGV